MPTLLAYLPLHCICPPASSSIPLSPPCPSVTSCPSGTDKMYSSRYLERALTFAKTANQNIQDIELPVLIVVQNKEDVDACETDIQATSQ